MKLHYSINSYLRDIEDRNFTASSCISLKCGLKKFAEFIGEDIETDVINKLTIIDYKHFLKRRNLNVVTVNRYLIAIRSFITFCKKNEIKIMDKELIELAKEPEKDRVYLTEEEMKALLESPEFEKDRAKKYRDLTILHILCGSGLRREELRNLRIQDIDLERSEIKIFGKGRKIRLGFLTKKAKKYIKKRLKYRDKMNIDNDYLIQSCNYVKSERIREKTLVEIVAYHAKKAGIAKKVSPHILRHTFATQLFKKGADIYVVQRLLGHRWITATQRYVHVNSEYLKKQHRLLEM